MKFASYLITLCFLLLLNCASREEKLEKTKEYVNQIKEALTNIKGESIVWTDSSMSSRSTYYIIDDKIKYINEEQYTRTGHFVNLYYFNNDKLVHINSRGMDYVNENDKLKKKASRVQIYFDDDEVLESIIIENGVEVELNENNKLFILDHSKKLMSLAREDLNKDNE
ncbi:MAG: hypothetical protein R6W68_12455 [Ignavibacteriaceae bacterium]